MAGTGGAAGFAEDKIVATLKRIKAVNANVSTIFYYNSVLDWPFYRLHLELLKRPSLATHDRDGKRKAP